MRRSDLVLGITAVALLAAATLGVFRFEAAEGGGSSFRVTYATREADGPGAEATLGAGQSASKTFAVATQNVTDARFTLSWTDEGGGDPHQFRFTITDPQGIARSAEGESGALVVQFAGLAAPPGDARMLAASAAQAQARAAAQGASGAAVGTWRLDVTLVSAPGTRVGGVEVQPDGANAWRLASAFTVYEARVTRG